MTHDSFDAVQALVKNLQAWPYIWPSAPEALTTRQLGAGTCAGKHAVLAEELTLLGVESVPLLMVGPLLPPILRFHPEFRAASSILEVHECLTVLTPWAGPLRVDITWDPPLIRAGLPGALDWDGVSDMPLAVGEDVQSWSVPRNDLRRWKEALRGRLYGPGERETRDEALAKLVLLFDDVRDGRATLTT